ncbi:ArgE/DapE family deacylase [Asanoa sp. NPDC049573]|uniref:M20 family metallopeptidase n=1 Tax=Asanoa sp. NPDC049573 TaxID=3155396 RepID=UPI0034401225
MTLDVARAESIHLAVADRRAEMVRLLTAFCSLPAENPPGSFLDQSQDWIESTLTAYGVASQRYDTSRSGGDHRVIVGSIGEAGPIVYLHGHYDVVPAFRHEQFAPEVRDGAVFGRGASDMKGGLVAMLTAALVHRDLGGTGQVRLVYVPDEETGGANGSERMQELGLIDAENCVGAIVGEPSFPEMWYAARGAFTIKVTVYGRPAHVGLHYTGDNAVEHGHRLIGELLRYRDRITQHRTRFAITPEPARNSIMLIGGVVSGGINFNIVPDSFSFTIDRRPNPDEDYAKAKQELLDLLHTFGNDHEMTVEVLQDVLPASTDENSALIRTLREAARTASGRQVPVSMCPGCLETRIYSQLGIPTAAFGPGPFSEMHGPDEHVPIDNLVESAATYAVTLAELLGTRQGDS